MSDKLHYVVATGIIIKDNKFLIVKRSETEKAYPGRWTVPGGKLSKEDYHQLPHDTKDALWYNIFEKLVEREIKEEVDLEVEGLDYIASISYIRPDGFPTVIVSLFCNYKGGEIKLCPDLTEYAWVTLEEAKNYDLIDGIYDELEMVDNFLKTGSKKQWTRS